MPNATAPATRKARPAIAAAALAWAPIGFVLGGLVAGRLFAAGESSGGAIAASALLGAFVLATLMAGVATRLPARPLRVTTVVAGGVSFALIIFLVRDFVADRMRQAEAFEAAYAQMRPFQLRVESRDPNRRPFSALTFNSTTHVYTAERPGGWLCRGNGLREHAFALARGLRLTTREDAASTLPHGHCATQVSWRYQDAAAGAEQERSACAPEALLHAADAMVKGTARRASCRRP